MHIGLGDISDHDHLTICIYIANRPPLPFYQDISNVHAIQDGEIAEIGKLTGNHWRKIFNVYAKLIYEFIGKAKHNLPNHPGLSVYFEQINHCSTWQEYRDTYLLKNGSIWGYYFHNQTRKRRKPFTSSWVKVMPSHWGIIISNRIYCPISMMILPVMMIKL